jgi:myo-inositol-1(or 4)-monophosphatase
VNLKNALNASVKAAIAAGSLMRRNLSVAKKIDSQTTHDIKLALDVRCQKLIQRSLRAAFPEIAFVGEEGNAGDSNAELRWVVDPIDGTVNFSYGIPHACVCIALQKKTSSTHRANPRSDYTTVLGVVYDPFLNELWTASSKDVARLNGKPIRVSNRSRLGESVCAMGYGKNEQMIGKSLRVFGSLSRKARKVRNMGSAGLALTYVACGRFDAYIEQGVSLWDIAAGGFIVERAGGEFWRERVGDKEAYRMITSNGRLRKQIEALR